MSDKEQNSTEVTKASGFWSAIQNFFSGLVSEFNKITWPDNKELTESTAVVIVFIVILTAVVMVFDWGIQRGLGLFLQ